MTRQPNGPAKPIRPMPDDEPPEDWDEVAPPDDAPESDTPATPTNPLMDPDMPEGVPVVPGHPETPVVPEDSPPGTLEEIAPEDPKDPLPTDDAAEPGISTKNPSPDTTPS